METIVHINKIPRTDGLCGIKYSFQLKITQEENVHFVKIKYLCKKCYEKYKIRQESKDD